MEEHGVFETTDGNVSFLFFKLDGSSTFVYKEEGDKLIGPAAVSDLPAGVWAYIHKAVQSPGFPEADRDYIVKSIWPRVQAPEQEGV